MYYMHVSVYINVPLILPLKFKVPQTSVGLTSQLWSCVCPL